MRNTWLHVALFASVLGWCTPNLGWLFLLFAVFWLVRLQKGRVLLSMCLLIFLQLERQPQEQAPPPATLKFEITDIKTNYVIAQSDVQKIIVYDLQDVNFQDIWEISGECDIIHGNQNFYLFDFANWANKRGIQYSCTPKQAKQLQEGNSMRARLYSYVKSYDEPMRSWLLSTLYGIQAQEEQESNYLIHASGMHLSYIAHLLQVFFTLWLPSIAALGLSLCMMMVFGSATIITDSLLRILFFRCATFLFYRESMQDRLGIGMIALLLWKPYMAQELSFVLPVLFRLIYMFQVQKRKQRLLAPLVLIPIQFYYFNEVNVVTLFLFPLLRKLYGIHFFMAILCLFLPMSFLYTIANGLRTLGDTFYQIEVTFYFHASILFLTIWFYFLFQFISFHPKHSHKILLTMLFYTQAAPHLRPYMQVVMMDVGQGDTTFISLPFQQGNILIDVAGNRNKNIPADIIVPQLHALGITSLDYVIITHDDFDHSGGLAQLQELMEVKEVIADKQKDIEVGGIQLSFLLQDQVYEDKNDSSIITFMEAYDMRLLFMGDAGKKVEQEVLRQYPNLQADIVKVGHHGSKTSSDVGFIHQLHPQLALISCGYQNRYGHPSPETMEILTKELVHTLDTPTQGAVSIKLTNFVRFYKTAADEFGIIYPR